MFKKIVAFACAAVALSSAAQAADFTGPRVGVNAGYSNGSADILSYGANVGYDFAAGEDAIVGVSAEISRGDVRRTSTDVKLEYSLTARFGGKASENTLFYVLGGYTHLNLENGAGKSGGVRVGAGIEYAVSDKLFLSGEARYSNYKSNVDGIGGVFGVGFRF